MNIDIHVHTCVGSGCSKLSPDSIPFFLNKKRINAICITEHGNLKGFEVADYLRKKYQILAFAGVEVRCKEGDVLVFGVEESFWEGISVEELIKSVHEKGGFIVACHPFRATAPSLHERLLQLKELDAIEVFSGNCEAEENKKAMSASKKMGLPQMGGSDAHKEERIGVCFTIFPHHLRTQEEFLEALRKKRFLPAFS